MSIGVGTVSTHAGVSEGRGSIQQPSSDSLYASKVRETDPVGKPAVAALTDGNEIQLATEVGGRGNSNHVVYDALYFAQYNPSNALDMVEQTPGFSLSEQSSRRGFSGAVGNLLIDGLRPNTKSQSASDILARIPADQVMRIELLRGAAVAGDPSGASKLLNVVRRPSVSGGIWDFGAEYGATPDVGPRGNVAYSGRNGQVEYGVSASLLTMFREDDAHRRGFDKDGTYKYYIDTPESRRTRDWSLNGDLSMPLWGGRLSSTAQWVVEDFDSHRQFKGFHPSGSLSYIKDMSSEDDGVRGEIGINYDRAVGDWDVSVIGLVSRENNNVKDTTVRRDSFNTHIGNTAQESTQKSGETILRLTAGTRIADHLLQFGAEGALNTLDQEFEFFEDTGSGAQLIAVPNSNVRIDEDRTDLFASLTWNPGERWSVETRMAWEASTLTFTGDADQSVDLSYWKPSLQIARTIREDNQLRFRIYRDVDQLDFANFVSAVSIAEDRINGGNPDLQPTTSWRAELGSDLRFGNDAALSFTLAHHVYDDVEEQVLIVQPGPTRYDSPIRFGAPGNVGDGTRTQLDASLLYPLDFLLAGAQITVGGTFQETEVRDPITGQARKFSEVSENLYDFEFRHDLPGRGLSWGFSWEKGDDNRNFRYDEIISSKTDPWITAFVETNALFNKMQVRLLVEDIGRRATTSKHRYFAPDRTGTEDGLELRHLERSNAPWMLVELSGRF